MAALYLTLLAAGADEATYDLGDFRDRFAGIVMHVEVGNMDFVALPAMWKALEQWTVRRHRDARDCRVLVLPPPPPSRYNKRIGYSKKLAFPIHRDEVKLARLLSRHGLAGDADPVPEVVQSAVLAEIGSFSEAFDEEFRLFSDYLVHARYEEAALTPFWGAISDITWQHARVEASTNGSYRIVLDPYEPALYLLADQRGRTRLGPRCEAGALPTPGKFEYLLEMPGRLPPDPAWLSRLASTSGFERLKPWRDLLAGCLAFFPDELGTTLSSDGTYYEDAPTCFLLRSEFATPVAKRAKLYNLKHTVLDTGTPPGIWKLVMVESASRGSMRAILDVLPGMINGVAGLGWSRPRPRLSGGAWAGQALLLNPASNPVVRMAGATEGTYELLAEKGRVVAMGRLVQAGDDGFQVPHASLVGLQGVVAVRYVLEGGTCVRVCGELRASVLGAVPSSPLAGLREPAAWLADGPSGRLEPMFPLVGDPSGVGREARRTRGRQGHPFLRASLGSEAPQVNHGGIDELAASLGWLCEAMRLRFESCTTLPPGELVEYAKGAAKASGMPSWDAWKLLHAGGWLAKVARRTSPYPISIAAPRTIALARTKGRAVARIAGMLGQAEIARIRMLLHPGERVSRLCASDASLSIGAVEVELDDVGRVDAIAQALGLQVLDKEAHGSPLARAMQEQFVAGDAMAGLPGDEPWLEVWDPRQQKWIACTVHAAGRGNGAMFRYQGSQKFTYRVATPGGHWKTDSEAWAWIFHVAAQGEPIGELTGSGACILDRRIWRLPPSLVRWWQHWGGGCVAMDPDGRVVLCGAEGGEGWGQLAGWVHGEGDREDARQVDIAVARRAVALKKRLDGRRARAWQPPMG